MNRVALDGQIVERSALRYTPAGIPALDFVIAHESVQMESAEAGKHTGRKVELQIAATAFGPMAQDLNLSTAGQQWQFEGFIAPGRHRPGTTSRSVRLHVQAAQPIKPATP